MIGRYCREPPPRRSTGPVPVGGTIDRYRPVTPIIRATDTGSVGAKEQNENRIRQSPRARPSPLALPVPYRHCVPG
jgi:hypothetical protein